MRRRAVRPARVSMPRAADLPAERIRAVPLGDAPVVIGADSISADLRADDCERAGLTRCHASIEPQSVLGSIVLRLDVCAAEPTPFISARQEVHVDAPSLAALRALAGVIAGAVAMAERMQRAGLFVEQPFLPEWKD